MPDFSGAYASEDSWLTPGSVSEVLSRLAAAVGTAAIDNSIESELGSRLAMRLWGSFIPTSRIPLRVTVTATVADAGTRVEVHAASNQGWYAVSVTPLARRIYDRGFNALFTRLRQAAPPA